LPEKQNDGGKNTQMMNLNMQNRKLPNHPSMVERLKISFKRPVNILFTEWAVFSQTLWVSFAWGLLFLFSPQSRRHSLPITDSAPSRLIWYSLYFLLVQWLPLSSILFRTINIWHLRRDLKTANQLRTQDYIPVSRQSSIHSWSVLVRMGQLSTSALGSPHARRWLRWAVNLLHLLSRSELPYRLI
jgi:hypothetical protein